eukprot:5202958-Pleurochrysis_carterae.AAC.3
MHKPRKRTKERKVLGEEVDPGAYTSSRYYFHVGGVAASPPKQHYPPLPHPKDGGAHGQIRPAVGRSYHLAPRHNRPFRRLQTPAHFRPPQSSVDAAPSARARAADLARGDLARSPAARGWPSRTWRAWS